MSENIEDVLFKQGILFDLDIGRWAAHKKLDKDDLFLQQINPNAFHLGHKKLMPKESIEKIQKIESAARSALMVCSADFPIAGARFVRYPVLENLQNKLLDLKGKYHEEVEQFLKNYPELRMKQMEVLNEQADILADDRLARLESVNLDADKKTEAIDAINDWRERQYKKNMDAFPSEEKLQEKFRFEWRLFKVSAADSLTTVSPEQALEAHKKLQGDLQEWIQETAVLMHKALGEAAAHANELLKKQGKLNPKNLKPLFDAFETFKALDFGKSDITTVLDELKQKYAFLSDGKIDFDKSATGINSTESAKEGLKSVLDSLSQLAIEEIAEEQGQKAVSNLAQYGRVVTVD